MIIAVIGLGSMGNRRIRITKELRTEDLIIGIDSRRDRCEETRIMFQIPCCESLNHVDLTLDCIFICTSPLSHHILICKNLSRECHVFTELNLISDWYEEKFALAEKKT